MGTDIACYAEVRDGGAWRLAEPLAPNPEWHEDFPEEAPRMAPQPLFTTRNYDLFAILADVRNPMRAEAPFAVIAEPRGFPEDAAAELQAYFDSEGDDAQDAGWLLVREIVDFDWTQTIQRRGMVDKRAAHLFPPGQVGFPAEAWPAGLPMAVSELKRGGVEVAWRETYREAIGSAFFEATLPKLASYGPADAVRIVFWFHS